MYLIIEANYELPIAFELTNASETETPVAHKIIDSLAYSHPDLLKTADYFVRDRWNYDTKLIVKLWSRYGIKPIVDIRNMWKDPEASKEYGKQSENVIYN